MESIDISKLNGSDLFDALASGKKIKKSVLTTPVIHDLWKDKELILIVHRITCKTCKETYAYPNGKVLLQRTHPTKGEHFVELGPRYKDPEIAFKDLFLSEAYRDEEVDVCQKCWNLAHVIEKARLKDGQETKAKTPPKTEAIQDTPDESAFDIPTPDALQDLRDSGLLDSAL